MKKSFPWAGLLMALLFLNLVVNVGLAYQYVKLARMARQGAAEILTLNERVAAANRDRAVLQALALESIKYAATNRQMLEAIRPFFPTFQRLGINVSTNPPAGQP